MSVCNKWAGILAVSFSAVFFAGSLQANPNNETQTDIKDICKKGIDGQGFDNYQMNDLEFNESGGRYSLTGKIIRHSERYEFNCVMSTRMQLTDLVINPTGHMNDSPAGAPAEVQMACADEAEKYWQVKEGTAIPGKSRATGGGMFEVDVAAGKHRGVCTVTGEGAVKYIMNRQEK